ncbi:39S ribosomal protein L33, mitochondrial [Apiotrichum porosum]|uniref:Large ribosomal subunit protein bL33m n=1 Tax=Apiotrichum porosum TaxID=105984 RepID=A0A427XHE7_9TREE|nr:39S ribosomal protein L33, mitochondrial [Apiotrichum porosum]RSH78252.1 39S ribosomal protein L33, mitochondrial [Apiotrichum porosum]
MAPKAKQKRILVRLVSSALTGFFYTTSRARLGDKISFMKYDPVVKKHVLFVEQKIK